MLKRKQILQDHKKIKKKLIPPFNYMLEPGLTDLSWIDIIIPEVIWISLLNDFYGYIEGARLVAEVGKKSILISPYSSSWCFSVSSFLGLKQEGLEKLHELLGGINGDAGKIGVPIKILHEMYPKSPFSIFTSGIDSPETNDKAINRIKKVLNMIYDKTTVEGTFTQVNVVYNAFVSDKLKVFEGLALADFPEVEKYPHTEKSKIVAASIRNTVPIFFGSDDDTNRNRWWPSYFWNRGMEIEPCEIN